jgi:hypothetical protein
VKQSAARQSWSSAAKRRPVPRFDIAERTGYWESGTTWIASPGRFADLYVFAYHPIAHEGADHRNPDQWVFYVVPTRSLPNTKTASLPTIEQLSPRIRISDLACSVEAARLAMERKS